jgi:magnesium transporter
MRGGVGCRSPFPMLSVNIPRGAALERIVVAPDGESRKAPCGSTFSRESARKRIGGASARSCLPTREEMQKIEPSSRLYAENGTRYMTATMMCRSDTDNPTTTAVTFILADRRLITVSYDEPKPFTLVKKSSRPPR